MTRLATRIKRVRNSNNNKYNLDGNRFFTETPRDNSIESHIHGKLTIKRKGDKVEHISLISERSD